MIYLLSQIVLCLALAALLGGAIGWLLQRARTDARLDDLHDALESRERELERARTDVAMVTDDYEDLRERSRVEIDALREDNRRLPALTENLEKSQLLVRQMIQRHDAKTRELTSAASLLEERLAQLQERVVSQERELVAARAGRRVDGRDVAPDAAASADGSGDAAAAGDPEDTAATDRRGWASLPLAPDGAPRAEPLDETLDEVMEVDESLAAELLDDTFDDRGTAVDSPAPADADVAGASDTIVSDDDDGGDDMDDEDDANATLAIDVSMMEDVRDPDGAGERPVGPVGDRAGAGRAAESTGDGEGGNAAGTDAVRPLFRPVERQDDLKRIFGITPVTEKALNELGITSYPQLAELERPEIEKIARALEIVPEEIERDDWVGNARRQLEDVLEEL